MKDYILIEPPVSLDFTNMKKKEREDYYNWYLEIMPERLNSLINVIKSTKKYKDWNPDYSPNSLKLLGQWFNENVKIRKQTKIETEEIYNNAPDWFKAVDVDDWELTNMTFSIAFDIGMYLANVFLKNHSSLIWKHHNTGRKDHEDYGQPVISGFNKKMQFNPTRISVTAAYGFADNTREDNELKRIYDIWLKMYT